MISVPTTRAERSRLLSVALGLALFAACSARPPEKIPDPEKSSSRESAAVEPEDAPQPSRPELHEEAIEPRRDAALPSRADPSPTALLGRGASPQVVAATRLAEEGHDRMQAGDAEAALDLLERAVALDPNNAFAYQYLAEAYLDLDRYDQALSFADRAAALGGSVPPVWRSRTFTVQGQILETAGNFDRARGAYRKALATDPANSAARAGLERLGDAAP